MFKNLFQKFRKGSKEPKQEPKPIQPSPEPAPSTTFGLAAQPKKKSRERGPVEKPKAKGPKRPPKQKKPPKPWDISQFDVPEAEGRIRFHDLDIPVEIMHAIADLGFQYCTPIQAEIMPKSLAGSDSTGKAQTGTGKSAAFLVTIYTHLLRNPIKERRKPGVPRVLILAPTRELALQIEKDARAIGKYTRTRILSVFGGLGYDKQRRALEEKIIDIVAATPGRLLDFHRQRLVRLDSVEILIIDEADRMLDMGFIPDVSRIVRSTPKKENRQTMFFSATITPEVERLAEQWTRDPVHVEIEPEHVAADSVDQKVFIVTTEEKFALLLNLITTQNLERVLVFVNRRDQTRRLAERLIQYGINCAVLSGEVPQNKRIRTLEGFRDGSIRILVATDVAARGLHVEGISHVVNFTLPRDAEDYVHRIGRTGRAGASGISVSFACEEDSFYLPPIEEYLGHSLSCVQPDQELLKLPPPLYKRKPLKGGPASRPRGGGPQQKRSGSSSRSRTRRRPRSQGGKTQSRGARKQ